MSMREKLKRVLSKMVIPMNDRLVDVEVGQWGMGEIYLVTYFANDRIDYADGYKIEKETRRLFTMLSPEKHESIIIQYRMVGDE